MALISIEDLTELDDEQLDDEIPENSQPANEEEEERLLTHWQAVGRMHQVTVPRGTDTGVAPRMGKEHYEWLADLRRT